MTFPMIDIHAFRRKKAPRRMGFEKLNDYIDFEVFRPLLRELCKYSDIGAPHYDEVLMFKILILQSHNTLDDVGMEAMLYDRISFLRFVGLNLGDEIPDSETIRIFRDERLGPEGTRRLFDMFNERMQEQGLQWSKTMLIDSTFIEVPKQHIKPEEKEEIKETGKAPEGWSNHKAGNKDLDATSTRKGSRIYFGEKASILVDAVTKIVKKVVVCTAKRHDSQEIGRLIEEAEELVDGEIKAELYGDSAYYGKEIEKYLLSKNINPKIMRRRVRGQAELSEEDKEWNKMVKKIRARVEHVFAWLKQIMGFKKMRCIGIKRCTVRVTLAMLTYNMYRFSYMVRTKSGDSELRAMRSCED